ncbi:MAG: hypothetical protein AAGC58_00725 [Asticcacaulis sp.]
MPFYWEYTIHCRVQCHPQPDKRFAKPDEFDVPLTGIVFNVGINTATGGFDMIDLIITAAGDAVVRR